MNVLVRGLGSIGQRHARIAMDMGHTVIGVSAAPCDMCPVYTSLGEAFSRMGHVDLVIIATATARHAHDLETLKSFAHSVSKILVEKPLAESSRCLNVFASFTDAPVLVAYNLRMHPCILRLRELLADQHLESIFFYVGQYLPSWRPDTDYRASYSASDALGGGVLRDLSHELDLAGLLAGQWQALTAMGGHISHLDISSDDVYSVLSRHERCCHVLCHMNYLDRTPRRHIVVNTQRGTYLADLIAGTVSTPQGIESFAVDRDSTYTAQLRAILQGTHPDACTLEEGARLVRMIESIEQSARQKDWVHA